MRSRTSEGGFAYVALMIAVAIIGMTAAAAFQGGALLQRRDAEQALIVEGLAFARALDSYAKATPAGQPAAPAELANLLKDSRFPGTVRHLRRVPVDPLTGRAEWGLVKSPDGQGIIGVYSLAPGHPIKIDNFMPALRNFRNRQRYSDWIFMPMPALPSAAPATAANNRR
jgi:type II secretory pathway pseudopilin PulG